ncbi:MAG TPA: hypothetical protein VF235_08035 [Actinomycetota bacterium]
MRFRRKELPPSLATAYEGFLAVLEPLEPAKAALTDVLPGTRMPGRPLADALAVFVEGLMTARARMDAWRHPELEAEWAACDNGLDAARDLARRVGAEAPEPEGFEGLLWLVEELLDPLDPFVDAEARFRALRRRVPARG